MKNTILLFLVVLFPTFAASAQKTNDAIAKEIKSLKADRTITLSYDTASNASKIMVRADSFDGKEASAAGIQAMNFGMAFFYPGKALAAPPDSINLTFWVLTKKPRFAAAHGWTVTLATETLNLGDARYESKPGDNMEYLNFKVSRAALARIAAESSIKFHLGTAEFTFTPAQITIFKNLLAISNTSP